ncbi:MULTISPECIES: preprotein translocase subunit YajC [Enterococcus]|jgi:preprotein translocase subunit YajC|uniref:preprotein translocase subunit YajC n=1 Tax=Enterococcus TaxID=1350 RepID=UPI0018A00A47|nr:preprotein translocase subunit YajC [Enterococcus dispar]
MSIWNSILGASIVVLVFVIAFAIIYYFIGARGMKSQKEHFKTLHQSLAPGQEVKFANGLYGTIKVINQKKETVDIEVKSGTVIEVSRYAISEIMK